MRNVLPFDNLGYSVLLSLDNGNSFGSGFRLKYKGLNFIVTARHVLFDENNNLRCKILIVTCQDIADNKLTSVIFELDMSTIKCKYSIDADVAVIFIGWNINYLNRQHPLKSNTDKYKNPSVLISVEGITLLTQQPRVIASLEVAATRSIDEIKIGNDAYIMGYPISIGIKSNKQIDYKKPLLRKGIIAGINTEDNLIILDCPVYFGNSGGPVVEYGEDDYYRVVGIVSQYVPFENEWINYRERYSNKELLNSGYSVAVPITKAFDLIEREFLGEMNMKEGKLPDYIKSAIEKFREENPELL